MPRPTRLYLITHAHTQQVPSVDAREWILSSQGTKQADALADLPWWSEVVQLFVSSENKTALTVGAVRKRYQMPVDVDARFDELQRGGWVGDYVTRVQKVFSQPDVSIGGWESGASARTRFEDAVADLSSTYSGRTIALVSHGLVLSLFRAQLMGASNVLLSDWKALSFAAVALVDLDRAALIHDFVPVTEPQPRG